MKHLFLKHLLFFLAFCLPISSILGQKPPTFGAFTDEELAMTSYELDPSADAVVLLDVISIEAYENITPSVVTITRDAALRSGDIFGYIYSRHVKIKLLKASAFDRADISIPYTNTNNVSNLYNLYAQTISPKGVAKELTDKAFKSEHVAGGRWLKKFSFEAIEEGCIIEYSYQIQSKRIGNIPSVYMQRSIPVVSAQLNLIVKGGLEYTYLFKGLQQFTRDTTEEGVYRNGESSFVAIDKSFFATKLPAYKDEPYLPCIDEYRLGVVFALSATNFDGANERYDTWKDVGTNLLKLDEFGTQITKKTNSNKIINEVRQYVEAAPTDSAKIEAAYKWLSEHVTWDGEYSAFADNDLDDAFAEKSASSGELNLMLLAICNAFDIKNVYPAITNPLSEGTLYKKYPFYNDFNHVMVFYSGGATPRWYDVHGPFNEPGKPHSNALSGSAWIVTKDEIPRFEVIKPSKGSDAISFDLYFDGESGLKGILKGSYMGYNAIAERRGHYQDSTAQHWVERLKNQYPDVKIDSVSKQNMFDLSSPFKEQLRISLPDAVTANADMLYVSPIIFSAYLESEFTETERKFPISFAYPTRESVITIIHIPDDYELVELPKTVNLSLTKGNDMTYTLNCQMGENNTLQVTQRMEINTLYYEVENYPDVKHFYDRMAEAMSVQVVFKKK